MIGIASQATVNLAQTDSSEGHEVIAMPQSPATPFHIMLKPRGPICNLDCKYCYFLSKERLYPGSAFRMDAGLLETYTRQVIAAHPGPEVTFAWQGGEPTLMGLDFFRRAVAYQQQYARPDIRLANTLQTNGMLLDDDWGHFLRENDFLVGLSIDGPRELHDAYRVDKGGQPTFDRVMRGLRLLQKHEVTFNVLTTVHAANAAHPLPVYRFLRDQVRTPFMQFIPIVERDNETGFQEGDRVTQRSVAARQYGAFLVTIFEEWVRHDVGRVFVQLFDVALGAWLGQQPALCIFRETCGEAMAMEHNGDLYSCDHYVEPDHLLGNIRQQDIVKLVSSEKQQAFGQAKRDTLPGYCRRCDVRFVCNGGCPKNRFIRTPDGEPGLNYLCAGYQTFFRHVDGAMQFMARELRANRAPANVMAHMARRDAAFRQALAAAGRNDPCPCGSGRKLKQCHGRRVEAHAAPRAPANWS